MYSMTKCDNIDIKAVYNYKNGILLLQGADYLIRTFDLINSSWNEVVLYNLI